MDKENRDEELFVLESHQKDDKNRNADVSKRLKEYLKARGQKNEQTTV